MTKVETYSLDGNNASSILIENPELRRRYVEGVLAEELYDVVGDVNQTFREFSEGYIVIMDAEPS